MQRADVAALAVKDAQESLAIIKDVFANKPGPALDIVALNAGAAIYAADLVDSLEAGVKKAQQVIDSGAAQEKLDKLVALTQSMQ